MGRGEGDFSQATVCDGSSQCGGGLSLSSQSGVGIGVDSGPSSVSGVEQEMGGERGHVCKLTQSPLFCVFCSGVGSHGCGHGCYAPVLGSYPSLCVSSFCFDKASVEQVKGLNQCGDHVDCSPLEAERVVSGPSGVANGTSSKTSVKEGPVVAAPFSQASFKPRHAGSSCLETIQRFAKDAGFSSRVAAQLAGCRRRSSMKVYQSKWNMYRYWCRLKDHSISNPSIPKAADFLLWLWDVKKLSLSSIKAYRSMLAAVFKFKLRDMGNNPFLSDLIRSFAVQGKGRQRVFPAWDLNKVLSYLSSDTFEPLEGKSLRTVTMKVLFLVALATAKRVGELQALSKNVPCQGKDLILSYLPSFLTKTEVSNPNLSRFFPLRSLEDFVGGQEDELLLCPVRALRIYLKLKGKLVHSPASLFISPRKPSRSLSKNAISYFLRRVIVDSGALLEESVRAPRAHSIRGVATSISFLKNFSISKVLEAASWKSNSVFSLFYFKDIQYVLDDCKSLSPFVAAGTVIN